MITTAPERPVTTPCRTTSRWWCASTSPAPLAPTCLWRVSSAKSIPSFRPPTRTLFRAQMAHGVAARDLAQPARSARPRHPHLFWNWAVIRTGAQVSDTESDFYRTQARRQNARNHLARPQYRRAARLARRTQHHPHRIAQPFDPIPKL